MLRAALVVLALLAQDAPKIRVAIYADGGASGGGPPNHERCLKESEEFAFERVKAEEIRKGALSRFDVLIMPGGSARKEGEALGEEGRAEVKAFVEKGGGYVGFCAGAYLATVRASHYLKVLDAYVVDTEHWNRGTGTVKVKLTEEGKKIFGAKDDGVEVYYANGPLLAAAGDEALPDFTPLGHFETEIVKNGASPGVMKGAVAIASGSFGKGRVFCFSPHPEKTKGLEDFVRRAVRWAAGR